MKRKNKSTDPTKTTAFKRWFGKSKAVDMYGRPIIFYHGTNRGGFTEFSAGGAKRREGIFFSPDRCTASSYTSARYADDITPRAYRSFKEFLELAEEDEWEVMEGVYIVDPDDDTKKHYYETMNELKSEWEDFTPDDIGKWWEIYDPDDAMIVDPTDEDDLDGWVLKDINQAETEGKKGLYHVYLKMENPYIVDGEGVNWDQIPWGEFGDGSTHYATTNMIVNEVIEHRDFDGVIFKNIVDTAEFNYCEPADVYVVFKSTQIKSAYENLGKFDPKDEDIRNPRKRNAKRRRR